MGGTRLHGGDQKVIEAAHNKNITMSASPDILIGALKALPITILIVSEEGVVLDINDIGIITLTDCLKVGDLVSEQLRDPTGRPLDVVHSRHGCFKVGPGHKLYRFISGAFRDDTYNYVSVCIFNGTYEEVITPQAQVMESFGNGIDRTFLLQPIDDKPKAEPLPLTKFELSCIADVGLGLREDANAAFVKYSPTHQLIECSQPMRGFTQQEMLETPSSDFVHPDDVLKTLTYQTSVMQDPRQTIPVYLWERKLVKTGGYVHTELIGAYHTDQNGLKWLSGVERVVDTRKMAHLLTYVTDQLPCAIMMVDRKTGRIEMVNQNAQEWMNMKNGVDFSDCIESQRNIIFSSSDCDRLLKAVQDAYQQTDEARYIELTLTTLQKRTLTFLCKAKIPLIQSSAIDLRDDGILLWVVDITGFSNKMDERHMAVLRFVRCISHDMRTPMQAISLASHAIKESSGDMKENVEIISSSTAILETMLSNILEFKPASDQELPLPVYSAVDVKQKVNNIVHILKFSTLKTNEVVLDADCRWPNTRYVWTDDTMFDRILLNLVCNALKFTKKGHVKVVCSFGESAVDEIAAGGGGDIVDDTAAQTFLKIVVSDTGRGMDLYAAEHLGQLDFFKGDEGGFGLGTYIVSSYLKALGGNFHVSSKLNKGSVVSVEIPIRSATPEEVAAHLKERELYGPFPYDSGSSTMKMEQSMQVPQDAEGAGEEAPRAMVTDMDDTITLPVLVAEDTSVNRKLIVKALVRLGYTVDEAENGQVALEKMLENDYRTVLMDMNMPKMNGDEAIRAYWKQSKALNKLHHPKIIVLTGNTATTDYKAAIECGAHGIISSPVVSILTCCFYPHSGVVRLSG